MLPFAELLKDTLQAAGVSVSALARESGLPRRTIANWLEGTARKPRDWRDILRIAGALKLDRLATDDLLVSAGFPTVGILRAQRPADPLLGADPAAMASQVGQHIVAIIGESGGALFQDLPLAKAVYLLDQTVSLAGMIGDRSRQCALLLDLARCRMVLAQHAQAIEALHIVIDLAGRLYQSELALTAQTLLHNALCYSGRASHSEAAALHRTLQTHLKGPLPHALRLSIIHSLGLYAHHTDAADAAEYHYRQLEALSGWENGTYRLLALNNRGDLAIRAGTYERARRLLTRGIDCARPGQPILSYIHTNLGITAMHCGDYAEANQHFEKGLALAMHVEDSGALFTLHLHRSELALLQRDYPGAARELTAGLLVCMDSTFRDALPALEYCSARIAQGQGGALLADPCYRALLDS